SNDTAYSGYFSGSPNVRRLNVSEMYVNDSEKLPVAIEICVVRTASETVIARAVLMVMTMPFLINSRICHPSLKAKYVNGIILLAIAGRMKSYPLKRHLRHTVINTMRPNQAFLIWLFLEYK